MLGVGAGHPEATAHYASPYETLATYVDQLRLTDVPAEGIVLAALGPRVLRLAADRLPEARSRTSCRPSTPAWRARSSARTGCSRPSTRSVLDADPERGRALGRKRVSNPYLHLVNYTSNLRRLGFTDEDLADGGSDRLVDALVAHGSPTRSPRSSARTLTLAPITSASSC